MNSKNSFLYKITVIILCMTTISMQAMIPARQALQKSALKRTALMQRSGQYPRAFSVKSTTDDLLKDSWRNRFWSFVSPAFRRKVGVARADERKRLADEMIERENKNLKEFWQSRSPAENLQLKKNLENKPREDKKPIEVPGSASDSWYKRWFGQ